MFKLHEKAASKISFEIGQIDELLATYSELLEETQSKTPDLVKTTALASVLHSFYNGIENIFLAVAKNIDRKVPKTAQWHRDLLTLMTKGTTRREPVLTPDTANLLADYLGFRHYYRHSYSFFLEWEELERLVTPLDDVWTRVKIELEVFLDSMKSQKTET